MQENIAKSARKRAKDPAQERLREHKDAWNDVTSLLIAKLIAFKKGLNGVGDPRAEIPPTKITEPFPTEMNTYLSSIVDDYTHIMNGARFIMNEQAQYSKQHQDKPKKAEPNPELVAEASSALSRAWARVGLLGLSKDKRKLRLGILNFASDIIHDLYNLENELTSKDPDGHARAVLDMSTLLQEFSGGLLPMFRELVDAGRFEYEEGLKAFKDEFDYTPTRQEVQEAGGWVNFTKKFKKRLAKEEKHLRKLDRDKRKTEREKAKADRQREKEERKREKEKAKEEKQRTEQVPDVPSTQDRPEPEYAERVPETAEIAKRWLDSLNAVYAGAPHLEVEINQLPPGPERDELRKLWNKMISMLGQLSRQVQLDPAGLILQHQGAAVEIIEIDRYVRNTLKTKTASFVADEQSIKLAIEKMNEIEKVAHNAVTRWYNRKLLEMRGGKSDVIALQAVRFLHELNTNLNHFMDLLESKNSSDKQIYDAYKRVALSIKKITFRLIYLGKIYILDKKRHQKPRKTYLPLSDKDLRDLERMALRV